MTTQDSMTPSQSMTATFVAPDIECGGCAVSIQKALGRLSGVQDVAVDVSAKTVTVLFEGNRNSREQLIQTLTEIDFPPEQN